MLSAIDLIESTTFLLPAGEGESEGFAAGRLDGGLQYRYSASEIVRGEQAVVMLCLARTDESSRHLETRARS